MWHNRISKTSKQEFEINPKTGYLNNNYNKTDKYGREQLTAVTNVYGREDQEDTLSAGSNNAAYYEMQARQPIGYNGVSQMQASASNQPKCDPCACATSIPEQDGDLWDMQFCRWWGYKWLRKREEMIRQQLVKDIKKELKKEQLYKEKIEKEKKRLEEEATAEKKRSSLIYMVTNKLRGPLLRKLDPSLKKEMQECFATPCASITYNNCYCEDPSRKQGRCTSTIVMEQATRKKICKDKKSNIESWVVKKKESKSSEESLQKISTNKKTIDSSYYECPCDAKGNKEGEFSNENIQYLSLRMNYVQSDDDYTICCTCEGSSEETVCEPQVETPLAEPPPLKQKAHPPKTEHKGVQHKHPSTNQDTQTKKYATMDEDVQTVNNPGHDVTTQTVNVETKEICVCCECKSEDKRMGKICGECKQENVKKEEVCCKCPKENQKKIFMPIQKLTRKCNVARCNLNEPAKKDCACGCSRRTTTKGCSKANAIKATSCTSPSRECPCNAKELKSSCDTCKSPRIKVKPIHTSCGTERKEQCCSCKKLLGRSKSDSVINLNLYVDHKKAPHARSQKYIKTKKLNCKCKMDKFKTETFTSNIVNCSTSKNCAVNTEELSLKQFCSSFTNTEPTTKGRLNVQAKEESESVDESEEEGSDSENISVNFATITTNKNPLNTDYRYPNYNKFNLLTPITTPIKTLKSDKPSEPIGVDDNINYLQIAAETGMKGSDEEHRKLINAVINAISNCRSETSLQNQATKSSRKDAHELLNKVRLIRNLKLNLPKHLQDYMNEKTCVESFIMKKQQNPDGINSKTSKNNKKQNNNATIDNQNGSNPNNRANMSRHVNKIEVNPRKIIFTKEWNLKRRNYLTSKQKLYFNNYLIRSPLKPLQSNLFSSGYKSLLCNSYLATLKNSYNIEKSNFFNSSKLNRLNYYKSLSLVLNGQQNEMQSNENAPQQKISSELSSYMPAQSDSPKTSPPNNNLPDLQKIRFNNNSFQNGSDKTPECEVLTNNLPQSIEVEESMNDLENLSLPWNIKTNATAENKYLNQKCIKENISSQKNENVTNEKDSLGLLPIVDRTISNEFTRRQKSLNPFLDTSEVALFANATNPADFSTNKAKSNKCSINKSKISKTHPVTRALSPELVTLMKNDSLINFSKDSFFSPKYSPVVLEHSYSKATPPSTTTASKDLQEQINDFLNIPLRSPRNCKYPKRQQIISLTGLFSTVPNPSTVESRKSITKRHETKIDENVSRINNENAIIGEKVSSSEKHTNITDISTDNEQNKNKVSSKNPFLSPSSSYSDDEFKRKAVNTNNGDIYQNVYNTTQVQTECKTFNNTDTSTSTEGNAKEAECLINTKIKKATSHKKSTSKREIFSRFCLPITKKSSNCCKESEGNIPKSEKLLMAYKTNSIVKAKEKRRKK